MSIKAEFKDGVFAPLQEVEEPTPGEVYHEVQLGLHDLPFLPSGRVGVGLAEVTGKSGSMAGIFGPHFHCG